MAVWEARRDRVGRRESFETTTIQAAPVQSRQSMGFCEQRMQTIRAQLRDTRVAVSIPPDSPILPWAARHAAWLYVSVHQRKDLTFRRESALDKVQTHLLMFGKSCICRRPDAQLNTLDIRWRGIWLGCDAKTDEHFVGTDGGVEKARAVRRMVDAQQKGLGRVLPLQ